MFFTISYRNMQKLILINCKKKIKGSITIEVALVLPLFMFCLLNLITLFEMIHIHSVMDSALNQVGKEISTYANFQDVYENSFLTEAYVRERVIQIAGREKIENSVIVGGISGIKLWRSEVRTDNDVIDLIVTYRVKPWFAFEHVGEMVLINRCCVKAYTGYEREELGVGEGKYYIADTGEVYHLNRTCTHLLLSISMIEIQELESARNMYGSAYSPCEICFDEYCGNSNIYITEQGDRYHAFVACPGLKRTIYVISASEIGNRPLCLRCMKEYGWNAGSN